MAYASLFDLETRLGSAFSEIYSDRSLATEDLIDAQAEIDGVLAIRYITPVELPGPRTLLKGWTLTLAEERAFARTSGSRFADKVKVRVAQVRARLDEIRKEQFRLPGAVEQTHFQLSFTDMETPVFTRDNLRNF